MQNSYIHTILCQQYGLPVLLIALSYLFLVNKQNPPAPNRVWRLVFPGLFLYRLVLHVFFFLRAYLPNGEIANKLILSSLSSTCHVGIGLDTFQVMQALENKSSSLWIPACSQLVTGMLVCYFQKAFLFISFQLFFFFQPQAPVFYLHS